MSENNTLFIMTKYGLKVVDKSGIFESHMWLLNDMESSMKYVSLHKSKSDRAYRGGEILEIREATEEEISAHQELVAKHGREAMAIEDGRKVVVFKWDKAWKAIWPAKAKTNPMAYKGTGYVECPKNS
jgi:hypothetical protein